MQDSDAKTAIALSKCDVDGAPIPSSEKSLLKFAEQLTTNAHKASSAQIEHLRELGWNDPEIAEAVYIIALFAFFNRVADAFGLQEPVAYKIMEEKV